MAVRSAVLGKLVVCEVAVFREGALQNLGERPARPDTVVFVMRRIRKAFGAGVPFRLLHADPQVEVLALEPILVQEQLFVLEGAPST